MYGPSSENRLGLEYFFITFDATTRCVSEPKFQCNKLDLEAKMPDKTLVKMFS